MALLILLGATPLSADDFSGAGNTMALNLAVAADFVAAHTLTRVGLFDTGDEPPEVEEPEGPGSGFYFKLAGFHWNWLWGIDFIPSGIGVELGYELGTPLGVDTVFRVMLKGGYSGTRTYRAVDFTPNQVLDFSFHPEYAGYTASLPSDEEWDSYYNRINFDTPRVKWEVGVKQGILWNDDLDKNLLEGFLYYRGRWNWYWRARVKWGADDPETEIIRDVHDQWQAAYDGTDAYGIVDNSFIGGIIFDTVEFDDKAKTYNGFYAEASFEASPYFRNVLGPSDFYRVNGTANAFLEIFKLRPEFKRNLLSIYLAEHFAVDYIWSKYNMPIYAMQTFGGTDLRYGLGGGDGVRGFEKYTWDTNFKVVNNIELRVNGPAIGLKHLVPGFLVYFDAGIGAGYFGYEQDESQPAILDNPEDASFMCSTGVGIFLDLLGVATARYYVHFPLYPERLDGQPVVLTDINLDLHF
jgi:hypothetical protein